MALGPVPRGLPDWRSETCIRCHPSEGAAWRLSGHATAREDPIFVAALADDEPRWCNGCHAPLSVTPTSRGVPSDAALDERGVGCAACHASGEGEVLATRSVPAPHPLKPTPALTRPDFCGNCHQFPFAWEGPPRRLELASHTAQQDTLEEWRRWSAGGGATCAGCHMPGGDHGFGGVRRLEALKAAVKVTVKDGALHVSLVGVGHALPTGDVMRGLSLELSDDPLFTSPVTLAEFRRELLFQRWPGESRRRLGVSADTRLLPGEPRRLPIPAAARPFVAWRLVYHLVSAAQEARAALPSSQTRLVVSAGVLP